MTTTETMTETMTEETTEMIVAFPEEGLSADYAMIVNGNGLYSRGIFNGDYVFIKSQGSVKRGDIAALNIAGEPMLKQIISFDDECIDICDDINGRTLYTAEDDIDCSIIGVVTGLQRRFKNKADDVSEEEVSNG